MAQKSKDEQSSSSNILAQFSLPEGNTELNIIAEEVSTNKDY